MGLMHNIPEFRYDTDTIQVGNLTLDAIALNAFLSRMESLYGSGTVYQLGGSPAPNEEATPGTKFDCTGVLWWATFRSRLGVLWPAPNKNWLPLSAPVPGCCIRHSAPPGSAHGHAGMVIWVEPDGSFATLDSSSTDPKPRNGAIRYTPPAECQKRWLNKPDVHFVVSAEAVIAVDGVPTNRPLNIWLAAAKRPIAASIALVAAVVGGVWWWQRRRKKRNA